jgi:DNA-binding XRE family transcriptional regulator
MDFSIVNRAGLTQSEFAHLCGVSRVSVCLWMNGHASPHHLHDGNIIRVLRALEHGVASRLFPVNVPRGDSCRAASVHDAYQASIAALATTV